jgi:hypothetical protein
MHTPHSQSDYRTTQGLLLSGFHEKTGMGDLRQRSNPHAGKAAFGAKGGAIFRILVLFNRFSGEHAFL